MRFVPFAYIVLCLVSFAYSLPVPVGREAVSESQLQTRAAKKPTITVIKTFLYQNVPFDSGEKSDFRKKNAARIVGQAIREKTSLSEPDEKKLQWEWHYKAGNGDGKEAGYSDVYSGYQNKLMTVHYQLKAVKAKKK
ncbi:hypothetical protein EV361DRAFT_870074 [Lentinula raphanica]|nr:hypothetical protein EV361DRAFT_870074 [Lentinula raphanica]